jgi:DNA polymerase III sliding clamp (beta) subunit (PCNA family)
MGCAALILGTGAGVGAYSYVSGELERTYRAGFQQTLEATESILTDLNMPILEKTTDGTQTKISTERADGTPMTIKIIISDVEWTTVSVRTGAVGMWKKDISTQFHEFIAERLQNQTGAI